MILEEIREEEPPLGGDVPSPPWGDLLGNYPCSGFPGSQAGTLSNRHISRLPFNSCGLRSCVMQGPGGLWGRTPPPVEPCARVLCLGPQDSFLL